MHKVAKILVTIIIITGVSFSLSFLYARKAAVDHLQISTIRDEESYQRVKKNIYRISSDEVRNTVFAKDHYEGPNYSPFTYTVNYVKCIEIKGFDHFIFAVNFTVKDWRTVESLIYVDNGRIYNSHRRD